MNVFALVFGFRVKKTPPRTKDLKFDVLSDDRFSSPSSHYKFRVSHYHFAQKGNARPPGPLGIRAVQNAKISLRKKLALPTFSIL